MTSTPTLALTNFSEPFTIEIDASRGEIGVVFTQQGKLVAYLSWALGVSKHSCSSYAKEMLAVVIAV